MPKPSRGRKVRKHIADNVGGMFGYGLYHFWIRLLGEEEPIKYDIAAKSSQEAWVIAALKASCYNPPAMQLIYQGMET